MHDGHDEARLIERLRRRDEAAFNELVRLYEDRIFRLVLRMIGDRAEAEDLAQEVFVTVFKSIDTFRGDSKLSTWMYRVATNHCRNRIKYLGRRARHRRQPYEDDGPRGDHSGGGLGTSAHIPGPEAVVEGRQTERLVQAALLSLSEEHRALVVLRDVEGLSYEEIQRITALPEGTVKSKLHRARVALAQSLAALRGGRLGEG
jgi:RNA polymerase sigma-70 factor (ECF subfamily)